jgi:hypothetical protein
MRQEAEEHDRLRRFARGGRLAEQQQIAESDLREERASELIRVHQQMNIQFLSLQRQPASNYPPGFTAPLIETSTTLCPEDAYTTSRFPTEESETDYLTSLHSQIELLNSQLAHTEFQRSARTFVPSPFSSSAIPYLPFLYKTAYTILMALSLATTSPKASSAYLLGSLMSWALQFRSLTSYRPSISIATGIMAWSIPNTMAFALGGLMAWMISSSSSETPGSEPSKFKRDSYWSVLGVAGLLVWIVQGGRSGVPYALLGAQGLGHAYAQISVMSYLQMLAEAGMSAIETGVDYWGSLVLTLRFVLNSWARERGECVLTPYWGSVESFRWRRRVNRMLCDPKVWVAVGLVIGVVNLGWVRWVEWSEMIEPRVMRMTGMGARAGVVSIGK